MKYPEFYKKVNEKRKQGMTDTEILDGLSRKSRILSKSIINARSKYSTDSKIKNDRDLLNTLSMGFSKKMPTVRSVPVKEEPTRQREDLKMIEPERKPVGERLREVSPVDVAGQTMSTMRQGIFGGLKQIGETVLGAASLPQQAGRIAAEKFMGRPAPKEFQTVREMADKSRIFERKTPAERGGAMATGIAEYMLPGRAGGKLGMRMLKEGAGLAGIVGAQEGKVGREAGVSALIGGAFPLLRKATSLAKSKNISEEIKKLVGAISQGKIKDIPKAKKALSSIDTKGIKTFKDLTKSFDDKITEMAKNVDKFLGAKTEKIVLKNLAKTEKVGDKSVSHNYVNDAINQLKELYKKTNDPVGVEKITQLKNKVSTEGITIKEINDIARKYGNEFSSKAFRKGTGEPLTSVNAQSFENTRRGIKSTARELFGDDAYKIVDKEMSNIIRAKDLVKKVSEKANDLSQRIEKRGLGEKLGRRAFNLIDTLSGRTMSGFLRAGFIPRGGGLKTLNALDLEKNLQKNLKQLKELEKVLSKGDKEILKKVEKIYKGIYGGLRNYNR